MKARWIVGVDGSVESRAALVWALRHRSLVDADVTVVLASDLPTPLARQELDSAISDLVGDLAVERSVVGRSPGRALIDAAGVADGAAIVVGRRGSGGGWHFGLGSTSRYCVTHATVPTIVVPTGWEGSDLRRVVVGFDGSAHSAAALRWALDLATPDTKVSAIMAVEVAPWLTPDIVRTRLADEVASERRRLTNAVDAADPGQTAIRQIVVRGARPALSDACADADLVVLGRRGAGGLSSIVIGSVSTWMLDAASVPVAVVPDRSGI